MADDRCRRAARVQVLGDRLVGGEVSGFFGALASGRVARPRRGHRAAVSRAKCARVTYEQTISDVVKVVEAVGAGIMIAGGLGAFVAFIRRSMRRSRTDAYERLRRDLGRSILLGLEVLIIADIVRTIIVDPTLESVAVLGMIVVIRIVLSFALEVEIEGVWPWRRKTSRSRD
jgi:uncharacterized membrane protein